MKVQQKIKNNSRWYITNTQEGFDAKLCQLVIVFGGKANIDKNVLSEIKSIYSKSLLVSASTAGEISNFGFFDEQLSTVAIQLENTPIESKVVNILNYANSYELGLSLFDQISKVNLKYLLILSDGNLINGTELLEGINKYNKDGILITGGLAGDGPRFGSTLVGLDFDLRSGNVVAIGFYGDNIQVGHGSMGGWEAFGPRRVITKSYKNVLFELDNKNALDIYKQYLGPYADELSEATMLFPFSISNFENETRNVRTIMSICEKAKSITFAGNVPEGSNVRVMKANFDKIISAAGTAAEQSILLNYKKPDLALLISSVGRKLILEERIDEEIEAAQDVFGENTAVAGFYSYGGFSPLKKTLLSEYQNQTMTITTLKEM